MESNVEPYHRSPRVTLDDHAYGMMVRLPAYPLAWYLVYLHDVPINNMSKQMYEVRVGVSCQEVYLPVP